MKILSRQELVQVGNSLNPLLHQKMDNRSMETFYNSTFLWVVNYTYKNLVNDEIIATEYADAVMEKIPAIIERFHSTEKGKFIAYLTVCIRNEFFNFIRKYRRERLFAFTAPDLSSVAEKIGDYRASDPGREHTPVNVYDLLGQLELHMRVPFKMRHILPLTLEELHYLSENHSPPEKIQEFLERAEELKRKQNRQINDLDNRIKRIQYELQMHHREPDQIQIKKARSLRRAIHTRNATRVNLSYSSIAELFPGYSKRKVALLIDRAERQLKAFISGADSNSTQEELFS